MNTSRRGDNMNIFMWIFTLGIMSEGLLQAGFGYKKTAIVVGVTLLLAQVI